MTKRCFPFQDLNFQVLKYAKCHHTDDVVTLKATNNVFISVTPFSNLVPDQTILKNVPELQFKIPYQQNQRVQTTYKQLHFDHKGQLIRSSQNGYNKPQEVLASCASCRNEPNSNPSTTCDFCEKLICVKCAQRCSRCMGNFCQLCSVISYDQHFESATCLTCLS